MKLCTDNCVCTSLDSEDNWDRTPLPEMTTEQRRVIETRARFPARQSGTRHVWTIMVERQRAHISSAREALKLL